MLSNFNEAVLRQLSMLRVTDIIDILIVTYLVYKGLKFIRDTRTVQLLKGIVLLIIIMQASYFLNLHTVYYLLSNAMQLGFIAILIVFQPELRRALEQLGRTSIGRWFSFDDQSNNVQAENMIAEIVKSCTSMSKSKIGALIVIEREVKLGDIIGTGIELHADVTSELLINIFIPKTPLHDGALIIRKGKIEAAACFLPLSQNPNLSKELGTRHRAGVGVSEESDAVVVIVSEETGKISIALGGELFVNLSADALRLRLTKLLVDTKKDTKSKRSIFIRKEKSKT